MQITVKTLTANTGRKAECLVLVGNKQNLQKLVAEQTKNLSDAASSWLNSSDFKNSVGSSHVFYSNTGVKRLVLLGTAKAKPAQAPTLAKKLTHTLKKMDISNAAVILGDSFKDETLLSQFCQNLETDSYQYTTTKARKKSTVIKVSLHTANKECSKACKEGLALGKAMNVTRELGNLPGNICTPDYLAQQARGLARKNDKLKTTVLTEKQLNEQGFGAFMSVAKGSDQKPRLIAMEYSGGKKSSKPYVFVGKGITFDSGGISIKPGAGMDEMKYDMCGAATVMGLMNAVLALKLPINVVGVIAAAENMPSGGASKPGDVVTSLSGKTIEILNTDAEGRLVLCDSLTWVKRFKPETVIDIATLTGACIVALGHHAHGLYSNEENLAKQLLKAGEQANDRGWQMPLWDEYKKQLRSPFADLGNIGGRSAGSVTAACFLSAFTEDYKWAHLDIAGTAWISGGNKGATGRPVPMLLEYLKSQC